jgi:hypothetical protein
MPAEKAGDFRYWRDPVFLFSLAVYALNREVIKPGLHAYSPFFHGHLNDCLLVPVALPIFLFVYRRLGLRPDDAAPRWWEIALHVAVWSLFYKWFGPVVLHHGVADLADVACFAGGGAVAWWLWRLGWKGPVRAPGGVSRRR